MKNLAEWLKYIETLHPSEIELRLDRIRTVAVNLNVLKQDSKIILVAGTNGKGSCCAMLESLAIAFQKSVGCYTSPHLVDFNERVRINGKNVDDEVLVEAFNKIEEIKGDTQLTFFEYTTLAALYAFKNAKPDLIIMEIGLGGRKDACNIVDPDVSIITTIARDHTDWLGDDLESIAFEKAGVIRPNAPVFIGDTKSYALISNVTEHSSEEFKVVDNPSAEIQAAIDSLEINPRQLLTQNVMLAVEAFRAIHPIKISEDLVIEALQTVRLNGRFQRLGSDYLVLDVAHNPQSALNLAGQLETYKNTKKITKVSVICGMMADKSMGEVFSLLAPSVDFWYFVDLDSPRAATSEEMLEIYKSQIARIGLENDKLNAMKGLSVSKAYQKYLESKEDNELLLVFGSFITVGKMIEFHLDSKKKNRS